MLESLRALIDVDRYAVPVAGPDRWWSGPLNVEALALGSVRCAVTAANAILPGVVSEVSAELVAANFGSFSHLRIDGSAPAGFASMSGYFACVDGWLRLHANFPHHAATLRRALAVSNREGLAEKLAQMRALEAENLIREAGGVAGAVRTRTEWESSRQGQALAVEPWIRFRPGERDREPRLAGLRVLDFTRVIAGPTATKFLASLGADVLRIDPPQLPELRDQHIDTGAGKRSALADLENPDALRQIRELVRTADVVILGYRPGALTRFGLDPDELHAEQPHLTVVHLDAWGDTGPWSRQRGFDSIVQAPTGIGHTYRHADGSPGALPVQALDHATGYGAAAAALALLARGGIAHLSLARTAQELFSLPTPVGSQCRLDVPMVTTDSPYGRLRQVKPFVGEPLPLQTYGTSTLSW